MHTPWRHAAAATTPRPLWASPDQADLLRGRIAAPPSDAADDLNTLDRHGADHAAKPAAPSGGDAQLSSLPVPQGSPQTTPTLAPELLEILPDVPGWVIADRGCDSGAFRQKARHLFLIFDQEYSHG